MEAEGGSVRSVRVCIQGSRACFDDHWTMGLGRGLRMKAIVPGSPVCKHQAQGISLGFRISCAFTVWFLLKKSGQLSKMDGARTVLVSGNHGIITLNSRAPDSTAPTSSVTFHSSVFSKAHRAEYCHLQTPRLFIRPLISSGLERLALRSLSLSPQGGPTLICLSTRCGPMVTPAQRYRIH